MARSSALVDLTLDDAGHRPHRTRQLRVDARHPETLVHRSHGERDDAENRRDDHAVADREPCTNSEHPVPWGGETRGPLVPSGPRRVSALGMAMNQSSLARSAESM